jgi:DNA invertase Pin-like site-specific DNA recombinase
VIASNWNSSSDRERFNEVQDVKVAIYARYSSDSQRDASIADQLRVCRLFAERHSWAICEEYTDHAVSGATLLRAGFQALMRDALNRRFDVVLAESLDRSAATRKTLPDSSSASPSPA